MRTVRPDDGPGRAHPSARDERLVSPLQPSSRRVHELAVRVRERLEQHARRPLELLNERRLFYRRHGGTCKGEHGYGRSELDFLKWLLRRGPLGGRGRAASRWWSGVNSDVAFHSELAAAVIEQQLTEAPELPLAVRHWLGYLAQPSPRTWYRAHNSSVVRAYLARAHEARAEPRLEQRFLGRVLIRLLCVQAVHERGDCLPLLARHADPSGALVARVLDLRWLYPAVYPLAPRTLDGIAQTTVDLLETSLWRSGLEALFEAAAAWLELPALTGLVRDGRLHYPDLATAPLALSTSHAEHACLVTPGGVHFR